MNKHMPPLKPASVKGLAKKNWLFAVSVRASFFIGVLFLIEFTSFSSFTSFDIADSLLKEFELSGTLVRFLLVSPFAIAAVMAAYIIFLGCIEVDNSSAKQKSSN